MALPTVKRVKALLKKAPLIDLKGRSGAGFSYAGLIFGPVFYFTTCDSGKILVFGTSSHDDDKIYV